MIMNLWDPPRCIKSSHRFYQQTCVRDLILIKQSLCISTSILGKPADVTEPQEGVGSDGVFKGDDGVDKEPIDVRPLLSHPGILAGRFSA